MLSSNYKYTWIIIFFLGICSYNSLYGQSVDNQKFVLYAFKSVKHLDRYQTKRNNTLKAYLTFHPLSISNDTVSMYSSNIVIGTDGEFIVESGRIVHIPSALLPKAPLQLIVQPIMVYSNNVRIFQTDKRFTEEEANIWTACGYQVQEPIQIRTSLQYR